MAGDTKGPERGSRLPRLARAIILEMLRDRVSMSQIARTCRVSRDQVRQVAEDAGIVARRPSRGGLPGTVYVPGTCRSCGQRLPEPFPEMDG